MSYSVEGGNNLDGIFIFVPFSIIQTKKMSRGPQNKHARLILLKQFFMLKQKMARLLIVMTLQIDVLNIHDRYVDSYPN